MTIAPWVPPMLTGVDRRDALWNAFISYAGRPIPLANGTSLEFAPIGLPEPDALCVTVRGENGPDLCLIWKAFPFNALLSADFSVNDLAAVPVGLREALIEGMVSLVWSALPEQRLGDFRIRMIGPLAQALDDVRRSDLSWFSVTLHKLAPEPVGFVLGCERSALLDVLSADLVVPQKVHEGLKSQLKADVFCTLGAMPITIAAMKSLAPGSVIVLPEYESEAFGLRTGDSEYIVRQDGANLTCLSIRRRDPTRDRISYGNGADTMESDTAGKGGAPSVPLSSLQLTIDFDLGRAVVSLSDLESWQAGSIIALEAPPRPEGAEVTLRANGQVVGTGDLVRIEDRYAVRISRIFFTA